MLLVGPLKLEFLGLRTDDSAFVGRRYFRFFKWLDCFSKAFEAFYTSEGVSGVLEVGKWSCMGAYLFLESVTIVSSPSHNKSLVKVMYES